MTKTRKLAGITIGAMLLATTAVARPAAWWQDATIYKLQGTSDWAPSYVVLKPSCDRETALNAHLVRITADMVILGCGR